MKLIHRTWRSLLSDLLTIACVTGVVGIALKFTVFFDRWVYFPWFPNVLDSAFLIFGACWLTIRKKRVKE